MNGGGFPEILGFESHIPMDGGGDLPAAPPRAVVEREKLLKQQQQRQEKERKNLMSLKSFPPLLTTLSEVDERPRFDLKKMTLENGRLVISMARNVDKTMILRCRTRDGRMLMWAVRPDCDSSDDDDDDDLDHDQEFKKGFEKGSRELAESLF